jgi:alpha-glucosidase
VVDHGGFTRGQPWLPIPETHRRGAVSMQESDQGSVLNAYRMMVKFRRAQPALRWGSMSILPSPDDTVAIVREFGGQSIIAVFNFGTAQVRFLLPAGARVDALTGHGFDPCSIGPGVVELPPAGVFFGVLRESKN